MQKFMLLILSVSFGLLIGGITAADIAPENHSSRDFGGVWVRKYKSDSPRPNVAALYVSDQEGSVLSLWGPRNNQRDANASDFAISVKNGRDASIQFRRKNGSLAWIEIEEIYDLLHR